MCFSAYLLADDIGAGLDIGRNASRPRAVRVVHHPNRAPDTVRVYGILGDLEEVELVDIHSLDASRVRGHPRRNWALVAVQPVRPVEGDVTAGTHLRNAARSRSMYSAAGHVGTVGRSHGANLAAAVGNSCRGWVYPCVDVDIPTRVAEEERREALVGNRSCMCVPDE
jgi:hypothetical protein